MLNKWKVLLPVRDTIEDKLAQFRNRFDLVSESGCGGQITFKYRDGSVITIKEKLCKS